MEAKILYRLDLKVPEHCYNAVLGLLTLEANQGWEEQSLPSGDYLLAIHGSDPEYLQRLLARAQGLCGACDGEIISYQAQYWQEAWKEFFKPIPCGDRFLVLPPWLDNNDAESRQKILIEPEYAFGTGQHATTFLCLRALDGLLTSGRLKKGDTFLDLGCGSGILGIGTALNGLNGWGVDIDELAIANADTNKGLNKADGLKLKAGSIESVAGMSFDLVMANILARPLIELAPSIIKALNPGGCLILSGILDIQAERVASGYEKAGLGKPRMQALDEWRVLIWS